MASETGRVKGEPEDPAEGHGWPDCSDSAAAVRYHTGGLLVTTVAVVIECEGQSPREQGGRNGVSSAREQAKADP